MVAINLRSRSARDWRPSLLIQDCPLCIWRTTPANCEDGDWYRNFEYDAERERGLDFSEDLFNPLVCVSIWTRAGRPRSLPPRNRATMLHVAEYRQAEITRRRTEAQYRPGGRRVCPGSLTNAADQYIVSRGDKKTVIAGYHWFSDWGRDTMIALPGLTLADGKA
jgi:predicted glycogen debranching enzyme